MGINLGDWDCRLDAVSADVLAAGPTADLLMMVPMLLLLLLL